MVIEITNLSKIPLDKKIFSTVAKKVLAGENRKTETLSLAFVERDEIKKLNKKFRGKDKPTDVLSFELSAIGGPASGEKKSLGEIVICPEVVKKNAEKYGVSPKTEALKVFIHGILHLLGYEHEKSKKETKKMEEKEKEYLSEFQIKNY